MPRPAVYGIMKGAAAAKATAARMIAVAMITTKVLRNLCMRVPPAVMLTGHTCLSWAI